MSTPSDTNNDIDSLFPVTAGDVVDHNAIPVDEREKLNQSGAFDIPVSFTTVPTVHELPDEKKKKGGFEFEYAEHTYLGDTIKLKLENGSTKFAADFPFDFYNGQLKLTYGQINGLAGDFYGTYNPICQGSNLQAQIDRFMKAYDTLAQKSPDQPTRQPQEAKDILNALQNEVNKINTAIKDGKDPSTVYHTLPDETLKLQALTQFRPKDQPSYLILASLNLDHFGADAQTAYNAGHTAALQMAQKGDLYGAYRLNAFADHFLQDRFSAGHLRTPRRMLSGDKFKDVCSKFMHDEDNAIGLDVQNPRGNKWRVYGDKRLADNVDKTNLLYCREAVQKSADEIYDCYKSKQIPSSFGVWQIAPTLASASGKQDCCPLFVWRPNDKSKEWRRKNIDDRRKWEFTDDFWYWSTLAALKVSKRWDYPIEL